MTRCHGNMRYQVTIVYIVLCVFCGIISVDTCGPLYRWFFDEDIEKDVKTVQSSSTRLKTLARALSPSFLRIGGTYADYLIFNDTQLRSPPATPSPAIRINRTRKKGIRDKDRQKGAKKKRIDNFVMTEPNQLDEISNILVSPEQLAQDFLVLREILDTYGFHNSFLVGPDVTNPSPGSTAIDFLKRFLCSCGNSTLATTWHSYSMDGKNASVEKFTNHDIMDSLKNEIDEVAKDIEVFRPHLTKSWIGETAGAYGGGAPGLSNTYVGGFLWLDKLGLAAANNVDLVIRQTFFGGHYGLLDKDSNPTPVFWLSVLYKQLVGPIVLKATSTSPNVRAYAHCTNNQTSYYNTGYVTIFIINLHPGNHLLITFTGELAGKNVTEYRLTADDKKNITDTKIDLNDKLLRLTDDYRLPLMKGKELSPYKPITLPPLSYGFFVIDANATACYQ